nr:MAG TPA: hypothetical protein [Caudoviricetes sp.]
MMHVIEGCQKRNIRFKINGRGCGTYMEQFIIDSGPALTDAMIDFTINGEVRYTGFFGDKIQEIVTEALRKRNYHPLFFTKERPLDWIFPNDHINYASDKMISMWKERHKSLNFETPMCLKTLAHMKPKCGSCEICKTPQDLKAMLKRPMEDHTTVDDIMNKFSDNRHVESFRVIVQVKSGWEFYDKDALSHYITSRFYMEDPELIPSFYGVGQNSTTWVSNNSQKGWFGGKFVFDLELKKRISVEKFNRLIDKVNSKATSFKVLKIYDECKALPVKKEQTISYIGYTDKYSMSEIKDRLSLFDWDIYMAMKSRSLAMEFEKFHMPELKDKILFTPSGNKILIFMELPMDVNPYLVMSSILNKQFPQMMNDFRFDIYDHGMEIDASCKCGNSLTYSLIKSKTEHICPVCEGKKVLYLLSNRKN